MATNTDYRPGDTANGFILGSDGSWHPLNPQPVAPAGDGSAAENRGRKNGRRTVFVAVAAVALASIGVIALAGPLAASAENAAATAPADPSSYEALSERDWQLIVKDPDAHIGRQIVVYAEVAQFDDMTGSETFRASAAASPTEYYFTDGENVVFVGDEAVLAPIVQGDQIMVHATVLGSQSYGSMMGGTVVAPKLRVDYIEAADGYSAPAAMEQTYEDYEDSSYTFDYDALEAQADARAEEIRATGGSTFIVPEDGFYSCIAPWDYMDDWTDADMEDYAQCLAA